MSGSDIVVNPYEIQQAAKQLSEIGDNLKRHAAKMRSLEMTATRSQGLGTTALFGSVPESAWLGEQYNGLISTLAAYGDKLGDHLNDLAPQMNTASGNYTQTDQSIAGG